MNTAYNYDIIENYQEDEFQDESCMIKTLCDLNIYDLMGVDHDVWIKRNSNFGFDIEIENDEEQIIFSDQSVHPVAIESLAIFCRRFLHGYSNLMDKELS